MKVPCRFKWIGQFQNPVCKLKKLLYGLKETLRQWNAKCSALVEKGFRQYQFDHLLFVCNKDGVFMGLSVYIDNVILISKVKVLFKSSK